MVILHVYFSFFVRVWVDEGRVRSKEVKGSSYVFPLVLGEMGVFLCYCMPKGGCQD